MQFIPVFIILTLVACTKVNDIDKTDKNSAPDIPPIEINSKNLEKTLHPLFTEAKLCLKECRGNFLSYDSPASSFSIPRDFNDFLNQTDYGQEGFLNLLRKMPPEFMKFGVLAPDESPELKMSGWASYRLEHNGDLIYIYIQVGLPEGVPPRREIGSLIVGVNPKTKQMAVVFRGAHDLSHYIFVGEPNIISYVIAYISADEAEIERAYKISNTQQSENPIFPIPSNRFPDVERRLVYLNSIFKNGEILGAQSPYAVGETARRVPPEKQWWSPNSSFSRCIESQGPAAKLDSFIGLTDKPETKDFIDSSGNLKKVEVINYEDGGSLKRIWSYYKSKDDCENEEVNATKVLADKYR